MNIRELILRLQLEEQLHGNIRVEVRDPESSSYTPTTNPVKSLVVRNTYWGNNEYTESLEERNCHPYLEIMG